MRPIAYGVAHFCKNKRGTGVGVPYEGFYWFGTKRDSGGVGEADAAPQIFDRGGGRGVRAGRQSGVSLRSTIRSDGQGDPVHGHGRRSGDADACLFGVSCRVVWKPDRIDDVPLQQRWDAHDKITEAWGPERKRVKHHHVFLRLPGEEKFLYAGQAHLGSYSAAEAEFTLEEKLPRSEWLRLRGYTGWLIDLNHRSERVDKDDLDSFRRLTAEIAGQEISHLRMTRFEEDVLDVHIMPAAAGFCISGIRPTTAIAAAIRPRRASVRATSCSAADAAASCWIARLITRSRAISPSRLPSISSASASSRAL
jgi:hypothetical protein